MPDAASEATPLKGDARGSEPNEATSIWTCATPVIIATVILIGSFLIFTWYLPSTRSASAAHLSSSSMLTMMSTSTALRPVLEASTLLPPLPSVVDATAHDEASASDLYNLPDFHRADASAGADSLKCVRQFELNQEHHQLGALQHGSWKVHARDLHAAVGAKVMQRAKPLVADTTFRGPSTASAFNRFLRGLGLRTAGGHSPLTVVAVAGALIADVPIMLPNSIALVAHPTEGASVCATNSAVDTIFAIDEVSDVTISGFAVGPCNFGDTNDANHSSGDIDIMQDPLRQAVRVRGSQRVLLSNLTVQHSSSSAIWISHGSADVRVHGSRMSGCANGISAQHNVSRILIDGNSIVESVVNYNLMAGIVVTALAPPTTRDFFDLFSDIRGMCPFNEPLSRPRRVLLVENEVRNGRAQGVYFDSVFDCAAIGNELIDNDKEGICLDFGCSRVHVQGNTIRSNGWRRRQTDGELEADFVLQHGRMADGSSMAQLPGVSLDNSCYNLVEANTIDRNGGGGIKSVRSSVRNSIVNNTITANNRANPVFTFNAIDLGAAIADYPNATECLDSVPSIENDVAFNLIAGWHQVGLTASNGSGWNDFRDNVIKECNGTVYADYDGRNLLFEQGSTGSLSANASANPI